MTKLKSEWASSGFDFFDRNDPTGPHVSMRHRYLPGVVLDVDVKRGEL